MLNHQLSHVKNTKTKLIHFNTKNNILRYRLKLKCYKDYSTAQIRPFSGWVANTHSDNFTQSRFFGHSNNLGSPPHHMKRVVEKILISNGGRFSRPRSLPMAAPSTSSSTSTSISMMMPMLLLMLFNLSTFFAEPFSGQIWIWKGAVDRENWVLIILFHVFFFFALRYESHKSPNHYWR